MRLTVLNCQCAEGIAVGALAKVLMHFAAQHSIVAKCRACWVADVRELAHLQAAAACVAQHMMCVPAKPCMPPSTSKRHPFAAHCNRRKVLGKLCEREFDTNARRCVRVLVMHL